MATFFIMGGAALLMYGINKLLKEDEAKKAKRDKAQADAEVAATMEKTAAKSAREAAEAGEAAKAALAEASTKLAAASAAAANAAKENAAAAKATEAKAVAVEAAAALAAAKEEEASTAAAAEKAVQYAKSAEAEAKSAAAKATKKSDAAKLEATEALEANAAAGRVAAVKAAVARAAAADAAEAKAKALEAAAKAAKAERTSIETTAAAIATAIAEGIAVKTALDKALGPIIDYQKVKTIEDIPSQLLPAVKDANRKFPDRVPRKAALEAVMSSVFHAGNTLTVFDIANAPPGTKVISVDEFSDSLLARYDGGSPQTGDIKARYQGLQAVAVDLVNFFDPSLDYDFTNDFTNVSDLRATLNRGGEEYKRPCGWKRYALDVGIKRSYIDTSWLGSSGKRGVEWPVSYHGTKIKFVESIVKTEYKTGQRGLYGRGVYSTPNISTAAQSDYAEQYEEEGVKYKLVIQNIINPDKLKIIKTSNDGEYWLIPEKDETGNFNKMSNCIRPYGILTKKL